MDYKISLITAVYNREDYIAHAIESAQNQTYQNVEHIFIDGASTDKTIEIIKNMQRPQDIFISEKDDGIYDALNKGIKFSTGEILGIIHSDDFFTDEHVLQNIIEAFQDPNIDGVYGDLDYVSAKDEKKIIRHWVAKKYSYKNIFKGWMPPHPTVFLRRNVIERWGGYHSKDYKISADYDALLRYLVKGKIKIAYIPRVLVKMRVGGESNRSILQIFIKSKEDLKAIRRNNIGGIYTLFLKNFHKLKQFI